MVEYIEKSKVLSFNRDYKRIDAEESFEKAVPVQAIKNIPAADVVEVVRCGQCKYGKYTGTEWFCDKHSGHADKFGEDASYHEYHRKYWFCADGEKRADNG